MGNIINQLIEVVNALNRIEVKGFENLTNLGLSIQELFHRPRSRSSQHAIIVH